LKTGEKKMKVLFRLILLMLVLLLSQVHAVSQDKNGRSPDQIIKEAVQKYEAGKFVEAYDLLSPLAKENKANDVAYFYLGMIAFRGNNVEAAEKCFRKAISISPDYAPPYSDLSAILMLQKKYDEAEKTAGKAIKLDPKYALGYANLGMAQLAQKKKKEARSSFLKAAELDPVTITNCGVDMLLKKNDPLTALYYFEISLDANPNQPIVLFNSGQAWKLLGEDRKALDMFKKAYDITKANEKPFGLVYSGYFRQLLDMGDYETIFKTGLARVGVDYPDGQLFRALAYYKMDRKAEFEKTVKKYFELTGEKMPESLEQWAKEVVVGVKGK
jgi:tetratricopeptide (TPR) repeat protein